MTPPPPPFLSGEIVMSESESGGPQGSYSDASAKYGPLKVPQFEAVDLNKMYGGLAQVRRRTKQKYEKKRKKKY